MSAHIVYVVMGQSGEYSDKREWSVAAYFDRAKADQHADAAHDWAVATKKEHDRRIDEEPDYMDYEPQAKAGPFDDSIQWSYTGVDYYVLVVPMLDEVPTSAPSAPLIPQSRAEEMVEAERDRIAEGLDGLAERAEAGSISTVDMLAEVFGILRARKTEAKP